LKSEFYTLIPHVTEPWIFLESRKAGWTLPCFELLELDNWQVVHSVNQVIQADLGINTTVLCCVSNLFEPETQTVQRVYILENHSPGWAMRSGGRWVSRAELVELELTVTEHRLILEAWFSEAEGNEPSPLRRPWAQIGWFAQATAWIHTQLESLGIAATGPVKQLRTWERSCVLRVRTTVGELYFKAVPALFAHEPRLMKVLAESYPVQVPQILAINPKQHWILMQDLGVSL